jgi:hypothetical protein
MSHPLSEETKRKISKANKGRKMTPAQRRKQAESRKRGFNEGTIKIPWKGTTGIVTWNKKGSESTSWKGGRTVDKNGYIWLRVNHPNSNSSGVIAEHRLVMSNFLGRPLHPNENVHHRNAIKDDNRIENLMLVLKGPHKGKLTCPYCHKEFFIR